MILKCPIMFYWQIFNELPTFIPVCLSVFCNDIRDHSFVACGWKGRSIRSPGQFSQKWVLKDFYTQAFLHDLAEVDRDRVRLIATGNNTWNLFRDSFCFYVVIDKHALIKKLQIQNWNSPRVTRELAVLLQQKLLFGTNHTKLGPRVTEQGYLNSASVKIQLQHSGSSP